MCITSQSEQRFLPTTHGAAWSMDQETLKVLSVVGSLFFFSCCVNFSHSPKVLDVISYHCNFDFSQGHFSQLIQALFSFSTWGHTLSHFSQQTFYSHFCAPFNICTSRCLCQYTQCSGTKKISIPFVLAPCPLCLCGPLWQLALPPTVDVRRGTVVYITRESRELSGNTLPRHWTQSCLFAVYVHWVLCSAHCLDLVYREKVISAAARREDSWRQSLRDSARCHCCVAISVLCKELCCFAFGF